MKDRLLLVDDNPDNLQVLYGALEQEGFELLIAQSGEEALAIAREARPQLILLDINMPGMDGYQTCRRLKSAPQTRESVIVFLSARGSVGDKVHGLELGAVDYIEKPFQFEEVVARVQQHLSTYHEHRKLKSENQRLKALMDGGFREVNEEDVAVLISDGQSERVEFKPALRWNRQTGKPDQQLENACLHTVAAYLNSEGGFLLVGVDETGNLVSLENERFANQEGLRRHWNGLIEQCLGVPTTPRIRSTVLTISASQVLVVQCLSSSEPVFFRRGNEEAFYVRTGNGTHRLSPSEVLDYQNQRTSARPAEIKSESAAPGRLGPYTLGDVIGSGGMGNIYRASHAMLHRPAAIKLLKKDRANETTIERFQREVQLTSQLTHPNTITIYDYGRTAEGSFYYVMELIAGITLHDLVHQNGPVPSGRTIHILQQVCGSLIEAHDKGLIHRDIKPANIMLSYRGGLGDFVKVLDFGLVKSFREHQSEVTSAGRFCGTRGYVAPEVVHGDRDIDARADLYGLGATAWFLVTGRPMLKEGSSFDEFVKHVDSPPRRPTEVVDVDIDPDLENLIMRCLARSPGKRLPNAHQLLEGLGNCRSASQWSPHKAAAWWNRKPRTVRGGDAQTEAFN